METRHFEKSKSSSVTFAVSMGDGGVGRRRDRRRPDLLDVVVDMSSFAIDLEREVTSRWLNSLISLNELLCFGDL